MKEFNKGGFLNMQMEAVHQSSLTMSFFKLKHL